MRVLQSIAINLVIGLNVFIVFFLLYGDLMEVPPALQVAGRLHPLLLHFPIVLLVIAFVFEVFRKRGPAGMENIVHVLLLAGSVSAALTAVMGLLLSTEDGYSGTLLQWHKWTGVAVAFLSALLWRIYGLRKKGRILYAVMASALITIVAAGHFGASLTHGENYVMAPIYTPAKASVDLAAARVYPDLVQPIFKEKCFSCHNPDKAKGQLVMTDTTSLSAGGESGKAILAGASGESLLIQRLLLDIDDEHRMPPKGKPQLSDAEIALIKAWVDGGADFTVSLTDMPDPAIRQLASGLYGSKPEDRYEFSPANQATVQQLNTNYRLVAPLALGSPALDVSFFNRGAFDGKSLEEIKAVAPQVVHLNLSGMPLEDGQMEAMASFPHLRMLNLNYTPLTDNGLAAISRLSSLKTLMVTGTAVSTKGLAAVLKTLKPERIYAWNTEVSRREADSLMKAYPGVRIDTGREEESSAELRLNSPLVSPANIFFRQPFTLTVQHPVSGTDLFYTLDGSEPDSAQSGILKAPVTISENTLVKVKAFKKGWNGSPVVEKSYQRTTYLPDSFRLATLPHPLHKGRGAATLFDLAEGSTDILYASDGKWLGYYNQEFIAELDFARPLVLNEIILSTLLSANLQAFPPAEVEIWGGEPGKALQRIVSLRPGMPEKDSKVQRNMINCRLPHDRPVTSLRIIARPVQKMPAWHPKTGNPAWFFIDEILLN